MVHDNTTRSSPPAISGATTISPNVNKESTLFRRPGCEKVAPAGQFEAGVEAYNLPSMTDGLSTRYQDLLDGSYDCVDRIVLNAYFRMGHSPGGFRVWWRALTGSDETLENSHLMRLAGRFSRRIRGSRACRHCLAALPECLHLLFAQGFRRGVLLRPRPQRSGRESVHRCQRVRAGRRMGRGLAKLYRRCRRVLSDVVGQ